MVILKQEPNLVERAIRSTEDRGPVQEVAVTSLAEPASGLLVRSCYYTTLMTQRALCVVTEGGATVRGFSYIALVIERVKKLLLFLRFFF